MLHHVTFLQPSSKGYNYDKTLIIYTCMYSNKMKLWYYYSKEKTEDYYTIITSIVLLLL